MYIDFTKRSEDPSFMYSILVQNKPLFKNRSSWDEAFDHDETLFEKVKSEPDEFFVSTPGGKITCMYRLRFHFFGFHIEYNF